MSSFSLESQFGDSSVGSSSQLESPMNDFQVGADISQFTQIMQQMAGSQGMPPGFPSADFLLSGLLGSGGGGSDSSGGANPLQQLASINPISQISSLLGR